MKLLLKHLHRQFYFLMVFICFCLSYPFLYVFSRKERCFFALNQVRKITAFLSSLLAGIVYKTRFIEKPDWSRTYIIVANHSSNLDIMALSIALKRRYFFLGKEDLLDNMVTAIYFKTIDIPVNRSSKIAAYKAFKKCGERLKNKMSLVVFPEGKIGDEYPPLLHPFKSGPFKLAIDNHIPILPVSIVDSWKLMWDDGAKKGSKPGICHVLVHRVVETSGLTEKDEENLKNNVFEIVHSALKYQAAEIIE